MKKKSNPVPEDQAASAGLRIDAHPEGTPARLIIAFAGPVGAGHAAPAPAVGRLSDALSGPLGAFALRSLRVRPRQARSTASVERILSTAADMTLGRGRPEGVTVERVANSAGVTPQAAYRYFKDVDELIATALRCVVIREHERLIELLSRRTIDDETEMAGLIVGIVLDTCGRLHGFPTHVQADLMREYRQIGSDAALNMSEIICRDANGLDVRSTIDVFKVSVAIAATIAVAASLFSRDAEAERRGRLEDMLVNLFVGVLRSGGGPSQAFREIAWPFDDLWTGDPG